MKKDINAWIVKKIMEEGSNKEEVEKLIKNKNIKAENVINKETPLGQLKNKEKNFVWNGNLLNNDSDPDIKEYDFDSTWIQSCSYNETLGILSIYFDPLATNGKVPVILGLFGEPIPFSFVKSFVNAESKGRFYLENIALFKLTPSGWVRNRKSKFNEINVVSLDEVGGGGEDEEEEITEIRNLPLHFFLEFHGMFSKFKKTFGSEDALRKSIERYAKKKTKAFTKKLIEKVSYKYEVNENLVSKAALNAYTRLKFAPDAASKKTILKDNSEVLKEIGKIEIGAGGKIGIINKTSKKIRAPKKYFTRIGRLIATGKEVIKIAKELKKIKKNFNQIINVNKKTKKLGIEVDKPMINLTQIKLSKILAKQEIGKILKQGTIEQKINNIQNIKKSGVKIKKHVQKINKINIKK